MSASYYPFPEITGVDPLSLYARHGGVSVLEVWAFHLSPEILEYLRDALNTVDSMNTDHLHPYIIEASSRADRSKIIVSVIGDDTYIAELAEELKRLDSKRRFIQALSVHPYTQWDNDNLASMSSSYPVFGVHMCGNCRNLRDHGYARPAKRLKRSKASEEESNWEEFNRDDNLNDVLIDR